MSDACHKVCKKTSDNKTKPSQSHIPKPSKTRPYSKKYLLDNNESYSNQQKFSPAYTLEVLKNMHIVFLPSEHKKSWMCLN